MEEYLRRLPQQEHDLFRSVVTQTDRFCDQHLDAEYKDLSRRMAAELCEAGVLSHKTKPASWAAGVVYSVGWVNFLTDPTEPPHVPAEDIAGRFGVSQAAMHAKARVIRKELGLIRLDPDWATPSMTAQNPLVWLVEVDGLVVDIRGAPVELQIEAYERGLIPHLPTGAGSGDSGESIIARIERGEVVSPGPSGPQPAQHQQMSSYWSWLRQERQARPASKGPSSQKGGPPTEIYELKITLRGTKPPIWRRVAVPGDIKLSKLHAVIQLVMGWYDCHLHQFVAPDGACLGLRDPDLDLGLDVLDEHRYRLWDIADRKGACFNYEYDFGDSWEHRVRVTKIGPPKPDLKYPTCLAGRGACPPEDCGGVWGYYELLDAVGDPRHERHAEMVEWLGTERFDAGAFDQEEVNRLLAKLR
jgi:hypothetical protein